MLQTFATKPALQTSSRLPALSRSERLSVAEIACLLACGGLAIVCVAMFQQLRIPVPGNSIVRAVLPIALGLALVPRQFAGSITSIGAALTATVLSLGQFGRFPPAAIVSVVALGPVLDLALAGNSRGWWLHARFVAAGAAANALAFIVKLVTLKLGLDAGSGRNFASFGWTALLFFIGCGAVAGLISAAICFRPRANDDLRRN
jgi:hypothetical protein